MSNLQCGNPIDFQLSPFYMAILSGAEKVDVGGGVATLTVT